MSRRDKKSRIEGKVNCTKYVTHLVIKNDAGGEVKVPVDQCSIKKNRITPTVQLNSKNAKKLKRYSKIVFIGDKKNSQRTRAFCFYNDLKSGGKYQVLEKIFSSDSSKDNNGLVHSDITRVEA